MKMHRLLSVSLLCIALSSTSAWACDRSEKGVFGHHTHTDSDKHDGDHHDADHDKDRHDDNGGGCNHGGSGGSSGGGTGKTTNPPPNPKS